MEGLLVGQTLGERYSIEEVIGRGGMSVVYRATDARLGRPVAVKVVSLPAAGADARHDLRERLRREAASVARIPPHPNVVQVYDYGTDARLDLDYIVMELLSGRDLQEAMRGNAPSAAHSLRILREAARGVAAGHRAGFVHRDVKPANIFLSGSPGRETAKILDFGIAKALEVDPDDDLTRTGLVPHSPAYASPEQLRGETTLSPAADVYQLGLVAYELLAGERPFSAKDREATLAEGPPELPSRGRWASLDPTIRSVVAQALRARPEERYPDAEAFVEALSAALVSPPTAHAPTPTDATELHTRAVAPAPPELDGTLLEPPPAFSKPATPVASATVGARTTGSRRGGRGVQLAVAGGLAVAGLWAITSLGGEDPGVELEPSEATASALDVSALDEEFRALQREAVVRLREAGSEESGAEAADAVARTLVDLNQSWVQGELERHLSHYAARVDFYDADDARRSRIATERGEELERYPDREIVLEGNAVTFPEPGRARALVEKSWTFEGPEGSRSGSGRQEYLLELQDGRWRVVSERLVELYDSAGESG